MRGSHGVAAPVTRSAVEKLWPQLKQATDDGKFSVSGSKAKVGVAEGLEMWKASAFLPRRSFLPEATLGSVYSAKVLCS